MTGYWSTHSLVWETSPRGRQIGLALGGGAVRGAAHIGVLSVLEEHGIFPEFIAGTSVGALIGGLYAAGVSAARLRARHQPANVSLSRLNAFGLLRQAGRLARRSAELC